MGNRWWEGDDGGGGFAGAALVDMAASNAVRCQRRAGIWGREK